MTKLETESAPRVVIVGGGFGGLAAAKALRKTDAHVILVDRQNHHLFQPLLYQVASAALSPGEIAEPLRAILRKQRNIEVLLGEVTRIDPNARWQSVQQMEREFKAVANAIRKDKGLEPVLEGLAMA